MKKFFSKICRHFTHPSPGVRMARAFWAGVIANASFMMFLQDWHGKEGYIKLVNENWTELHWIVGAAICFIAMVFYTRNWRAFEKETLWMTIKNPRKVTVEDDDANQVNMRPIKPPPPPAPPTLKNPPRTK